MSENPLESLRRQMRESEERLRRAGDKAAAAKSLRFERNPASSLKVAGQSVPAQTIAVMAEHEIAWNAYGQMTPGFLREISGLIAESVRAASESIQPRPDPELTRYLQRMERVRLLLDRWISSADLLPLSIPDCSFGSLLQKALGARKAEFLKWGIQVEYEDASTLANDFRCSAALYQTLLHVIQCCIEQLREGAGSSRLSVRIESAGKRLQTSFVCEFLSAAASTTPAEPGSGSQESLRSGSVEFRAAQRLLDSMGGTLVLENVSEAQRAIRIGLNISALPTEENSRVTPLT